LTDRVTFAGSVPQARLADYYRAADLLVLASSHEGLPNVVLESLASGTPVVATATGGAREILCGTRAGVLCERDARSIARAIETQRASMPERGVVTAAVERFDWQACADRLHTVLSGVAATRAAA
jgi:glycosyltransferase involved in cell wall biosynthesis